MRVAFTRPGRAFPALIIATLLLAGIACSLDTGNLGSSSAPDSGNQNNTGDVDTGTTPAVTILAPANEAQVPPNQPVDIRVATDSTTTSFLLNVNQRVASSRVMPEGLTGPVEAILTWQTPDQTGTYTLEVVASNRSRASQPARLTLTVSTSAASTTGSGSGSGCTGKVLISQLNFRSGPGTGAARLGQFDVGETVTVIGRNADGTWFQVQRANAQQVWVINNAQWFQAEGQCGDLPLGQTG